MTAIAAAALGATLLREGLLVGTAVAGVYGQGGGFAVIADAVSAAIRRRTAAGAERMRFASVMPRADLERIGYYRNFPQLLGTVHCFCGSEAEHRALVRTHDGGGDWLAGQANSDLVLIPAACYPVYTALAARGPVPDGGYAVQVEANCFRREPSHDPIRLQSFHMQEIVHVGTADAVLAFRDGWLDTGPALFADWGLDGAIAAADDPFFGRAAVVMAKAQRVRELKFEFKIAVSDADRPTACMSANYHLDSFGQSVGLTLSDGSPAHSACVGFGIERVTLALLRRHGTTVSEWPAAVRAALRLDQADGG